MRLPKIVGKRRALLIAAAALLAACASVPAQATVRERFRLVEPIADSYDCGFPVEVSGSISLLLVLREGKHEDAGTFPVLNHVRYRETHTNTDTGEWFTIEGNATFNEVEATRVEGSIFEFRFVEAGQPFVVKDADGNVVSRNRGAVKGSYLFDTLGDDEPGGEFVADVNVQVAGPHPDRETPLCEIASELIG